MHPLSYLVLDRPGPLPEAVAAWVGRGGRLITTPAALEAMGLDTVGWGSFPGVDDPVGWYGFGDGEVLALDNPAGLDTRSWARVLRPPPRPLSGGPFFGEESAVLTRTALAAERETPGYVWLPLVVLGYAVLVGPVNLWILRRRRRLEWAWFTIPALGPGRGGGLLDYRRGRSRPGRLVPWLGSGGGTGSPGAQRGSGGHQPGADAGDLFRPGLGCLPRRLRDAHR